MKKALIIIATILCTICLGIDIWCLAVYENKNEKLVSDTYNFDLMQAENSSEKKAIFEIMYYSNKNQNGLEMLEIKFNTFQDETMENFIAIGSQYVADTETDKISFNRYGSEVDHKPIKELLGFDVERNISIATEITNNTSYYEYQSANDFDFTFGNDINSLSAKSRFLVEIDNTPYYLCFKGVNWVKDFYIGTYSIYNSFLEFNTHFYNYVDDVYFASVIHESCKNSSYVSGVYETLTFADMFDIYEYKDGDYKLVSEEDSKAVKVEVNNNFVVELSVFEDGANSASDSMFGAIKGDSTFNLNGEVDYQDYFYGKEVINLTASDFDKVLFKDNSYLFVLDERFVKNYNKYSDEIVLNIIIDLDTLEAQDIQFVGFTSDCFDTFDVYKCITTETINGVKVERVVEYV